MPAAQPANFVADRFLTLGEYEHPIREVAAGRPPVEKVRGLLVGDDVAILAECGRE